MKKRVSVVVVVNDTKVLILKRSKQSTGAGTWNFPGGGVEVGETLEEAASRELKEEANLMTNPDDLKYIGTLETKFLKVSFFITDIYSGEVEINKESQDFKWIKISNIEKYKFVSNGSLHPNLIFEIGKYIYGGKR